MLRIDVIPTDTMILATIPAGRDFWNVARSRKLEVAQFTDVEGERTL